MGGGGMEKREAQGLWIVCYSRAGGDGKDDFF